MCMAMETSRRSRFSRVVAAFAGLTLAATAGAVAVPGRADARCKGEGVAATSRLYMSGNPVVLERPSFGTCNSDDVYNGYYESTRQGWTVWVEFRLNGSSNWVREPRVGYGGPGVGRVYPVVGGPDFRLLLCATDFRVTRCGFGDQWAQTRYGDPVNRTYTGISWGY